MNTVVVPRRRVLTGTVTGAGSGTATTLQFPTSLANAYVILYQFLQDHTGGSAVNHRPRIGTVGFTNDTLAQRYLATSVVVATPINDTNLLTHLLLDSNARADLKTGSDAGADNAFSYELWYEDVKVDV